jgi:hypothetical protein
MSKIDTSVVRDTAHEVQLRGALPAAPMAMPMQILEWPQRGAFWQSVLSLAMWRRPTRAGR